MGLRVVGAGCGRTGTASFKMALERLFGAPCYHMIEVFPDPTAARRWIDAAEGKVDWEKMFKGYTATVDWPGAHFWRELMAAYPTARVLLSVRDSDSWFASTQATVFSSLGQTRPAAIAPDFIEMFEKVIAPDIDGPLSDRASCIAAYERHNADVIRTVPKERLLVFDVKQGWEPLCRFLNVPVPAIPFPKANTKDDFLNRGPPEHGIDHARRN